MNLVKIQKIALIVAALIAVFCLNLFFILKPEVKDISNLNQQYKKNAAEIKSLTDKQSTQAELQKEKKFFKFKLTALNTAIPNYVVPEKFIKSLKQLIVENKLIVEGIDFSKPQEYSLVDAKPAAATDTAQTKPVQKVAVPVTDIEKKANKLITSIFTDSNVQDITLTGKAATEKELQLGEIRDENAYKVDVSFAFIGEYLQLKNLIKSIETSTNKAVINSFTLETAKDGQKKGSIKLTLYGFKDSKLPVYNLWSSEPKLGKSDLFSKVGLVSYDINDNNISDFDIYLSPITSDTPSVIVGKHDNYGTEIYGDNKGNEKVAIAVSENGGRFYYKYTTQNSKYPADNKVIEFKPSTTNDIVIKVFSEPRLSDADNSGVDLVVYNETNKNINVVPYNDDKIRPRLNVTIKR